VGDCNTTVTKLSQYESMKGGTDNVKRCRFGILKGIFEEVNNQIMPNRHIGEKVSE